MSTAKNKTFYCTCQNPTCNITEYTYKVNYREDDDSSMLVVPIYMHMTYFWNKYIGYHQIYDKIIMTFNIKKEISWWVFNVYTCITSFLLKGFYPIKVIYNIVYYLTNTLYGQYDIVLDDVDIKKANKILKKYDLNYTDSNVIINKKRLSTIRKIQLILLGYIDTKLVIEKYLDKKYIYYY